MSEVRYPVPTHTPFRGRRAAPRFLGALSPPAPDTTAVEFAATSPVFSRPVMSEDEVVGY